jgi:uncharacterized protein (TIGR03083 family)
VDVTTNDVLAALRASHDRLATVLAGMSDADVAGRAYPSEWSVGQTASHLGSGAEIFTLFLEAGATGSPAPGADRFQPIWATWNAKSPTEQARDSVVADEIFLDRAAALSPAERDGWHLDLFGSEQTLLGLLTMRLGEHAVHTWDIAVAADPAATIAPEPTAILVDSLAGAVARSAKPTKPRRILISTSAPDRLFLLEFTADEATLTAVDTEPAVDATLHLSAEALIRLAYGRLDGDNTPDNSKAEGVDLDELRSTFEGF